MLCFVATAFALATQQPPAPRIQEFAIDAGHTITEFAVGFAITHVKGRFTQTRGTILYDTQFPESSSVTIIMESKTLDTGWPHRDEHLRTDDFFDVEKYPSITFQSARIRRQGSAFVAEGPLTMHGVTKTVAIPFTILRPPFRSPESTHVTINARGSFRLNRRDFGVLGGDKHNSWFNQLRNATVSDTVEIQLEIEGWMADAASQRSPGVNTAVERIGAEGIAAQVSRFKQAKATRTEKEFASLFRGGDLVMRALIADRKMADALALARALAELYPNDARAHLVHGFALSLSGDQPAADRAYASAKTLFRPPVRDPAEKFPQDDEDWFYLNGLVRNALEWGKPRQALALAKVATELYPSSARSFVSYGLAAAESGDRQRAAALFDEALRIDPLETKAMEWKRRLKT